MYIPEGETPCQQEENKPDWTWFSKDGTRRTALAKKLCGLCPENSKCLASVLRYERKTQDIQLATYAGFTPSERVSTFNHITVEETA